MTIVSTQKLRECQDFVDKVGEIRFNKVKLRQLKKLNLLTIRKEGNITRFNNTNTNNLASHNLNNSQINLNNSQVNPPLGKVSPLPRLTLPLPGKESLLLRQIPPLGKELLLPRQTPLLPGKLACLQQQLFLPEKPVHLQ